MNTVLVKINDSLTYEISDISMFEDDSVGIPLHFDHYIVTVNGEVVEPSESHVELIEDELWAAYDADQEAKWEQFEKDGDDYAADWQEESINRRLCI